MKYLQPLKWLSSAIVVMGATILAASPEYAYKSVVPFVMMITGQTLFVYCSYKIKDWASIGMSVGFMCIDLYGIFVRLT